MGDGSTQALSKRTDAANFFFLITKNNSDPVNMPIVVGYQSPLSTAEFIPCGA